MEQTAEKTNYWLWYPGDFELYYRMEQDFSRVERGCGWPAFWKSEGFRHRAAFRRAYVLDRETTFRVHSKAVGHVLAGDKKYPFGREITCPAGEIQISIHAARIEAFPCVYVEGDVIRSDKGWLVEDYAQPPVPAGYN
ncbi:MAG: alpha-L-rhamnosidase, partial [Oscillospiraceae bacterium]|nr:alpha-L-rhamnosidase [Oscillospiraceae bacterium]